MAMVVDHNTARNLGGLNTWYRGKVSEHISQYRETGLYDLSEILGIQISPPRHEV